MADGGNRSTQGSERETWVVIHRPTRNIVAEYDNYQEAEDAAEWYMATWPHGGKLEVARA